MSDDDLIRDAVNELVAAAPPPKPLPMGGATRNSYRWLAIAAAVVLVVGGIVAIAWTQADDDNANPVATTQPPPPTSPPPATVGTSTPESTSPVTVPPTVPTTEESSVPTSTTTTTTSTTTTTTTTVPPTPEQAQVQDYLNALAEGRYDDAGPLLNEGGLEPERRADLRPLFIEYGDFDDPAARLQAWCENEAICTQPDAGPVDIGGYWMATWSTPGGVLTSYFRSGSFEGSPSVHGLPPRRATGPVVACPTADVEFVREADIDGNGAPETIAVTRNADGWLVSVCNTELSIPALQLAPTGSVVAGVLQPAPDQADVMLIGESGETGVCAATYRLAASAGALAQVGWDGCWGPDTGESIGCRDANGEPTIVQYRYSFVGGDRLDDSTAINVDVLSLDAAPIDSFTLALPDQIDETLQIIEPYCNGLPVVTEG